MSDSVGEKFFRLTLLPFFTEGVNNGNISVCLEMLALDMVPPPATLHLV